MIDKQSIENTIVSRNSTGKLWKFVIYRTCNKQKFESSYLMLLVLRKIFSLKKNTLKMYSIMVNTKWVYCIFVLNILFCFKISFAQLRQTSRSTFIYITPNTSTFPLHIPYPKFWITIHSYFNLSLFVYHSQNSITRCISTNSISPVSLSRIIKN